MRRLLALLVLAVSTLALTTPAHAGGPTSVMITDPAAGDATALYYADPGYGALDRMVSDAAPLDGEPSDLGARALNLTWMIHDVSPWRTQQLYLDAAGGPVVSTDGGSWARVRDGKALVALVDSVLTPGATTVVTAPAPDPVVEERVVTETAWWSLTGWRWAVLGLLLGAGAVLLVRRPSAPRRELVDLEPGAEVLTR